MSPGLPPGFWVVVAPKTSTWSAALAPLLLKGKEADFTAPPNGASSFSLGRWPHDAPPAALPALPHWLLVTLSSANMDKNFPASF